MKLVVILSRFPYPLEKGDKLRAYHQIKELSKKHTIYLICLSDQPVKEVWRTEVLKYCEELHVFRLYKIFTYFNTARQWFTDKPYQTGYFYSAAIHRKTDALIQRIQPDHIYCQLIRTAEYVKHIHAIPKTIDYMDALGKGMYRRAEIASGLKKKWFLAEGKRLTAYENRIFDYFDHHTIISDQDKKFIQHPLNDKIHVIENGVGAEFLEFEKTIEKKYDILFVGNLSYAPNIECAEFIVRSILPVLQKRLQVRVLICGASPGPRIQNLTGDAVTIKGWVDDIREVYKSGNIFVAPLFIGTGLQNKLLEAMALGIPCITTTLANNALKAPKDEAILIADSAHEFAAHILTLLENQERSNQLGMKGKQYVQQHFSWSKATEKLETVLESSQIR